MQWNPKSKKTIRFEFPRKNFSKFQILSNSKFCPIPNIVQHNPEFSSKKQVHKFGFYFRQRANKKGNKKKIEANTQRIQIEGLWFPPQKMDILQGTEPR